MAFVNNPRVFVVRNLGARRFGQRTPAKERGGEDDERHEVDEVNRGRGSGVFGQAKARGVRARERVNAVNHQRGGQFGQSHERRCERDTQLRERERCERGEGEQDHERADEDVEQRRRERDAVEVEDEERQ